MNITKKTVKYISNCKGKGIWKKKTYIIRDSKEGLIKVGNSTNPIERCRTLQRILGKHLELEYQMSGSDQGFKYLGMDNVKHPIKHGGDAEWYKETDKTISILLDVINKKEKTLNVTQTLDNVSHMCYIEGMKKQLSIRISDELKDRINEWARKNCRTLNNAIEALLIECLNRHEGKK